MQRRSRNKPSPAPYDVAKRKAAERKANKENPKKSNPLFVQKKRTVGIGQGLPYKKDMTFYVKWPKYVRVQRQKQVLYDRLKVPPVLNQFNLTADKNTAKQIFSLLDKYSPETRQEKNARLKTWAQEKAADPNWKPAKPPAVVKYGINHVTALIEQKKAKFVAIAHDVDPIEIVIWLPALCRKMGVPYAIVKGKARLGQVVNKKTATVVALTKVGSQHQNELNQLAELCLKTFNNSESARKTWGGLKRGPKSAAQFKKKNDAIKKASGVSGKLK